MQKPLLIFSFLLAIFLGCKTSNIDEGKSKTISIGNGSVKIDSFKTELVEYDDPKAFHLMISVSSKNENTRKRIVRINHNRPKGRIINQGNYEYINYISSLPFFQLKTDEKGEVDFYFISNNEFRLIVDYIHYLDIKPQLGKKMIISIYLD